jgi:DNA-binding NarL/FixJ family response regulator
MPIRVANAIRGPGVRDRLDRLVAGLSWAELCAVGVAALDLIFADAGNTMPKPAGRSAVVAVLGRPDGDLLDAAIRFGARGLILADDPMEDFRRAIHDVVRRGGWISPRLTSQLLARLPIGVPAEPAWLTLLTVRERQALRLLAEGRENAEIAATLYISVSAVKYHVSNILRKLDCRDRTQLVVHLNGICSHSIHL